MMMPDDAIDLGSAVVVNAPADVANWPRTVAITRLEMTPGKDGGLSLETNPALPEAWKWLSNPSQEDAARDAKGLPRIPREQRDNYQYTVWAAFSVAGRWVTSGFIQMWQGKASTGAGLIEKFAESWAYDTRWGAMAGHHPVAGEPWAFFITAGNARGQGGVSTVRERSNVVRVDLPAGDTGVFTFAAAAPDGLPPTPAVIVPPATPAPSGTLELATEVALLRDELGLVSGQLRDLIDGLAHDRDVIDEIAARQERGLTGQIARYLGTVTLKPPPPPA